MVFSPSFAKISISRRHLHLNNYLTSLSRKYSSQNMLSILHSVVSHQATLLNIIQTPRWVSLHSNKSSFFLDKSNLVMPQRHYNITPVSKFSSWFMSIFILLPIHTPIHHHKIIEKNKKSQFYSNISPVTHLLKIPSCPVHFLLVLLEIESARNCPVSTATHYRSQGDDLPPTMAIQCPFIMHRSFIMTKHCTMRLPSCLMCTN